MNKTIVIGDIHGRSVWKLIVNIEKPDRVIFLGDYFDSFEFSAVEQMRNFEEIMEYKKSGQAQVILLIGNHDHHYFPGIQGGKTSGYQAGASVSISHLVYENKEHLKIAYSFGEFLFTHAGVSSVFLNDVFGKKELPIEEIEKRLNEQFKYQPKTFEFVSKDSYNNPYGDDQYQGPLWIRPRSLMKANRETLRKDVIQIVGHTERNKVPSIQTTGGRYWFIDTLGTSGEYLIINNGEIFTKSFHN